MKTDLLWSYSSLAVLAASGILLNFIIAFGYNADTLGVFNQCFAITLLHHSFQWGYSLCSPKGRVNFKKSVRAG